MNEDLKPTIKDKNIFWASASSNIAISLITSFFIASFTYLSINYFDYGFWFYFLLFLDCGVGILIILIYSKNKIVSVK